MNLAGWVFEVESSLRAGRLTTSTGYKLLAGQIIRDEREKVQ